MFVYEISMNKSLLLLSFIDDDDDDGYLIFTALAVSPHLMTFSSIYEFSHRYIVSSTHDQLPFAWRLVSSGDLYSSLVINELSSIPTEM